MVSHTIGTIRLSSIKIVERTINGIQHYRNNSNPFSFNKNSKYFRGRHDRDRMVVGIKTTYAISAYHHLCCEFESRSGGGVQHYHEPFNCTTLLGRQ
jgi:hypothetical protein